MEGFTIFKSLLTTRTILTSASSSDAPSVPRGVTGSEPRFEGGALGGSNAPSFTANRARGRGCGVLARCLRVASHAPSRPPAAKPAAAPHKTAYKPFLDAMRSRSEVSASDQRVL